MRELLVVLEGKLVSVWSWSTLLFRSSRMNSNNNKILLLGDSGVGKSTLVNTLCGTPDARPESTVGVTIKVSVLWTVSVILSFFRCWLISSLPGHRRSAAKLLNCGMLAEVSEF